MSALRLVKESPSTLENQYNPAVMSGGITLISPYEFAAIDLDSAMQVPTVAKCDQLISGVIGGIPLELRNKKTGAKVTDQPLWIEQPDIRQPRSVTMAFTARSLRFHQVAYWEVTSVYKDDGRPARFAWVNNARVVPKLNAKNTEVMFYQVDGSKRPNDGIGSLITFQSLLPGALSIGARTIRAALDLEKAAAVSAATPMATTIIKNSGADLPETQVQGILAAWKAARTNRSTAYLTSTLEAQNLGFSPRDMMYNEAKQFLSTEICRIMNVPAYMASSDMNASMTYQNILDARKEFFAYTLAPFVNAIEDRLSMNDITNSQNIVKFSADETFLRADTTVRLATIEKMIELELITLDQAKAMENLTPDGSTL